MEQGQLYPLAKATEVLAERWTFLVIRELLCGAARFNEIRRGVPLMSPSLLSQRLQRLEQEGVVRREPRGSSHIYRLTEAGQELAPIVRRLSRWGERWVLGHIERSKPEATMLMWAIRRRVDPSVFGQGRTVVQFEFTDQPPPPQPFRAKTSVRRGHQFAGAVLSIISWRPRSRRLPVA